jgi:hypothetical protein
MKFILIQIEAHTYYFKVIYSHSTYAETNFQH